MWKNRKMAAVKIFYNAINIVFIWQCVFNIKAIKCLFVA